MGMSEARFPFQRLRRLRRNRLIRQAVADVRVSVDDLILPLFVTTERRARAVRSMPGVFQMPVRQTVQTIRDLSRRGLKAFILFGVTPPEKKDPQGSFAASPDCPVNRTLAEVRNRGLEVLLMADLCLCEYTDHGHCGLLCNGEKEELIVDNDRTLEMLGQVAIAQARAGADVVAPSGMMDGQVGAIRQALDEAGFTHTAIMSYAIKYASCLYEPFREAGESRMRFGDRRGYQMDFRRSKEWRLELEADLAEGADIVMVKPAVTYLDIVYQVRQACAVPVAAYHVSGEFAMLQAAGRLGWLDLRSAVLETTYAIKRAGADLILTYFAPQLLEWLKD